MTREEQTDYTARVAVTTSGSRTTPDSGTVALLEGYATPDQGGWGYDGDETGEIQLKGNYEEDAEPVSSSEFAFASGDYSNVLVSIDPMVTGGRGAPLVRIDVFYV